MFRVPSRRPWRPRRIVILAPALLAIGLAAGCASRSAPRVTALGDGVFRSPSAAEAQAYCQNFGAPTRVLSGDGARDAGGFVVYRCD